MWRFCFCASRLLCHVLVSVSLFQVIPGNLNWASISESIWDLIFAVGLARGRRGRFRVERVGVVSPGEAAGVGASALWSLEIGALRSVFGSHVLSRGRDSRRSLCGFFAWACKLSISMEGVPPQPHGGVRGGAALWRLIRLRECGVGALFWPTRG